MLLLRQLQSDDTVLSHGGGGASPGGKHNRPLTAGVSRSDSVVNIDGTGSLVADTPGDNTH